MMAPRIFRTPEHRVGNTERFIECEVIGDSYVVVRFMQSVPKSCKYEQCGNIGIYYDDSFIPPATWPLSMLTSRESQNVSMIYRHHGGDLAATIMFQIVWDHVITNEDSPWKDFLPSPREIYLGECISEHREEK